jgi:hypothetical protein
MSSGRSGSCECWFIGHWKEKEKPAACPGAASAPVGTPPVMFAAVAARPPCDGVAFRSAAANGDEAESHRRRPSRCRTSRDRGHRRRHRRLICIDSQPASAHSRPSDRRCETRGYGRGRWSRPGQPRRRPEDIPHHEETSAHSFPGRGSRGTPATSVATGEKTMPGTATCLPDR